ncbi:uncharacterized protein Pyn_38148 [Prunus yedoensis var. nudiflora]|uniref:DUF7788 domain-containing protein n=1 Tax=Prunus yedoensis var. nudiflora TaxID=2094558 RepID=A0A314ZR74_PRUYE|nr:uncharacterized protein Pyn_38148 [Prunus yedoensis var. nudiflora]
MNAKLLKMAVEEVAELQWKAMVEGIKKQGKLNGKKILNNCLAICNLQSMFKPGMRSMDSSVGLTLLMSELNEEPWKGKVRLLTRRVPYNWCWKVDFEKVLDLILEEAVNGNLKPEQMIKKSCLSDPRWWVKSSEQPGVKMPEGTADNLLKLVLDNGGEISWNLSWKQLSQAKSIRSCL